MKPKYHIKDARKIDSILHFSDFSKVDVIITSPPYFDVKNYCDVKGQIGNGQTYDEFLEDISGIFQSCYELSNDTASLWVIADTFRRSGELKSLPFDIANKLKEEYASATWVLKDIIIWDKCKNIPWHYKGRFKNIFEYILFFSKGPEFKYNIDRIRVIADYKKWLLTYPERYNGNGKPPENIWHYPIPLRGWGNGCQNHLCPFPFALVERIISIATDPNDFILDPFAGSGSVLAMAHVMGRKAFGLDINKDFKKRFEKEVLPGAKKYWEKRKVELKYIESQKRQFKQLNLNLRKIKSAIIFKELISENGLSETPRIIVICTRGSSKKLRLYVILPKKNRTAKVKTEINKILVNLRAQFKLDISFEFSSVNQIKAEYPNVDTLYRYHPRSIYKYSDKARIDEMKNVSDNGDYIYSNIALNLNKSSSVFQLIK